MLILTCKKCNNNGNVHFEYVEGAKFSSVTSFKCDLCGAKDNDIQIQFAGENKIKDKPKEKEYYYEYSDFETRENEFETDMSISDWVPYGEGE